MQPSGRRRLHARFRYRVLGALCRSCAADAALVTHRTETFM
jgi:hypothetical protein